MKKSRTIAFRLATSFGLLAVLCGVSSLVFSLTLRGIRREVQEIATDSLPGIELVNLLQRETLSYRLLTNRHVISDDPTEMADLDRQCDELGGKIAAQLRDHAAKSVGEERALIERIGPALEGFRTAARAVRALSREGKPKEAFALLKTDGARQYQAFESAVQAAAQYSENAANSNMATAQADANRAMTVTLLLGAVSLTLACGAGFWITRSVNRALQGMAWSLDDAASQVAAAAAQVSANSQGLAEGASEQAASLEETSSSLEELASMTHRNADHATSAKSLSAETRTAAEAGNADMAEMRRAMDAIKGSSGDISKIIKTIDEIAFQTNILALNAAVEAARAGEAGAGFAVVADEVRALAQRSATAAKETAAKIEESIAKSEHGATMSGKVAASLAVIVEKARKVDGLVGEIATASREQSQGLTQINSAVGQMDKVTQTNAGNAEETAAAAEELNAQSAALRESVEQLQALVGGQGARQRDAAQPSAPAGKQPLIKPARPAGAVPAGATPRTAAAANASASQTDNFFQDT